MPVTGVFWPDLLRHLLGVGISLFLMPRLLFPARMHKFSVAVPRLLFGVHGFDARAKLTFFPSLTQLESRNRAAMVELLLLFIPHPSCPPPIATRLQSSQKAAAAAAIEMPLVYDWPFPPWGSGFGVPAQIWSCFV